MDIGTLITVVAMIDAKIKTLETLEDTMILHARIYELKELSSHIQIGIDSAVSAMESNTGE